MLLIWLNAFFGIVIDTFIDLRGQRDAKVEDISDICFICSIDRSELDRKGNSFEIHTTIEHGMWNYLYYIVYIKTKHESEHTGIEKYISEKIKDGDIGWFPIGKSMSLDPSFEGDDDDIGAQFKNVNQRVDDLATLFKNIIKKQNRLDEANRENA